MKVLVKRSSVDGAGSPAANRLSSSISASPSVVPY